MSDNDHATSEHEDTPGQASSISIDALADRVFKMLLRDLEIEGRRAGQTRIRRLGER